MSQKSSHARFALKCFAIVASAITFTSSFAIAQTHNYSSSADDKALWNAEDAEAVSPVSGRAELPQYGQNRGNGYPEYQSRWSHIAFEAGGGFTAPLGNDHPFITYGYNLNFGAGWNSSKRFGTLLEYQFNRNKIPGATLAAVGAPGGNVNTWSLTVDPVFNYVQRGNWGGYVTGGGGFYRKVTNYTSPQPVQYCDYFYGYCGYDYQNVTIGHFSSNQGGLNIGTGVTWRVFGPDSRAKLYAEARYVWVDSPRSSPTRQGTGTEELIPVTIGIRF
jgi:hypothetical protein